MEVVINKKIENITLVLNEDEADLLKDIIEFAFDYESLNPNSLYTREKILGKKLIEALDCANHEKVIKINLEEDCEGKNNE